MRAYEVSGGVVLVDPMRGYALPCHIGAFGSVADAEAFILWLGAEARRFDLLEPTQLCSLIRQYRREVRRAV